MNSCSCVYVNVDGDGPEFYSHFERRARKEHVCSECGRVIQKGETYRVETGRWEGRFDTYKICRDCVSIRDSFFCEGYSYTMVLEDLREHIQEVGGEISEDCLAGLTPGAREVVCGMIEEVWEDLE